MPRTKKTNSLDELIAKKSAANIAKQRTGEITMNGREWHLRGDGSMVALIDALGGEGMESGAAYIEWICSMVVPEERAEFRNFIRRIEGLDADILADIVNAMTEELAERPTEPQSPKPSSSGSLTTVTPLRENFSSEDLGPSTNLGG